MKTERHEFLVKSKTAPIVELDMMAHAAYVRFKKGGVVRTIARQTEQMHLAVDVDKNGNVIGIEAVGFTELRLDKLIKKANVQMPPGLDLGKSVIRMTPCSV